MVVEQEKDDFNMEDVRGFFDYLESLAKEYRKWTSEEPARLAINPEIIRKLSRVEGFYQLPELEALVPAHAPVIRFFRLQPQSEQNIIIELYEDYEEKFMHFE